MYWDGQFNDSRFNIALAVTAALAGATVLNYAAVEGFLKVRWMPKTFACMIVRAGTQAIMLLCGSTLCMCRTVPTLSYADEHCCLGRV